MSFNFYVGLGEILHQCDKAVFVAVQPLYLLIHSHIYPNVIISLILILALYYSILSGIHISSYGQGFEQP